MIMYNSYYTHIILSLLFAKKCQTKLKFWQENHRYSHIMVVKFVLCSV